jgi:hypothetical protein
VWILDSDQPIFEIHVKLVRSNTRSPPCIVEADIVTDLVVSSSSGRRLEMHEDALVAVVDLVPSLPDPEAQVHVLVPVDEGGIEPAGLLEHGPANQHAGAGDSLEAAGSVDGGMIGREATVDVTRVAILMANHDAGVLNGHVRIEQLASDDGRAHLLPGVVNERIQPARTRSDVVIEKDQQLTVGNRGTIVAGRCEPTIPIVADRPD